MGGSCHNVGMLARLGHVRRLPVVLFGLLACLVACGEAPHGDGGVPPPRQEAAARHAERFMVAAANPHAVAAGLAVLRTGGNALDAAIAAQMVLGFVEAPETGIGGGGFLLYREGASGAMHVYDGRETAPAAAGAARFRPFGVTLPWPLAVVSGRAVGVPGLVAMLAQAHAAHGALPWAALLEPAALLAEQGVPMPPRLGQQLAEAPLLGWFGDMREYFLRQARAMPPRVVNPAYAATLRELARDGPGALYAGPLARDFVARARARRWLPSDLTEADLAAYAPRERKALCRPYRAYSVCSIGPPSSGGIALLQILGMLSRFDLAALAPVSAEAVHLVAEASRLAFADRERFVGDPDFVDVPTVALLDADYLARRAALIDRGRARGVAPSGAPPRRAVAAVPHLPAARDGGTSHLSVVDGAGNVVALTSSNEAPFAGRMMTRGFLLNNQLTDFSFAPELDGQPHPNRVAAGKRPRSSMTPVIVLDAAGEVKLVLGSRGGSRIIGYVTKALIGVLDWGLDVQSAIALPNFVHRGAVLELEQGTSLARQAAALEARGHDVAVRALGSGLHGIERVVDGWRGGADPRLDGVARGD